MKGGEELHDFRPGSLGHEEGKLALEGVHNFMRELFIIRSL